MTQVRPLSSQEKATMAARMMTLIQRDPRKSPTISVTLQDYKMLFQQVRRQHVVVDKSTEKVLFVILDKQEALACLKKEYGLYDELSLHRSLVRK